MSGLLLILLMWATVGWAQLFITPQKRAEVGQVLLHANTVGYYFEGKPIVSIWRKPGGKTQVEKWTAPADGKTASVPIDRVCSKAARGF